MMLLKCSNLTLVALGCSLITACSGGDLLVGVGATGGSAALPPVAPTPTSRSPPLQAVIKLQPSATSVRFEHLRSIIARLVLQAAQFFERRFQQSHGPRGVDAPN